MATLSEQQKIIRKISKRLRTSGYTLEELTDLLQCLEKCDEENLSAELTTGQERSIPISHYIRADMVPVIEDDSIPLIIGGAS